MRGLPSPVPVPVIGSVKGAALWLERAGQAPPLPWEPGSVRTPQGPMPPSGRIPRDGGRIICAPTGCLPPSGGKVARRMPRRMRGLPFPVPVPVIGPVRGVPPCGAGSFLSDEKGTKESPGDAPGGTTAPRPLRLSPAVRFPPAPRCGRRGPWAWRWHPARAGDDTRFPRLCCRRWCVQWARTPHGSVAPALAE